MPKIQVCKDAAFRREVAQKIVAEADPGYHGQGFYYADPVNGNVYYAETTRLWNPWSDDATIVAVADLVNQDSNSFTPSVDWSCADIPCRSFVAAYLEAEGEEFEENGDIPEWVRRGEVIGFARGHSEEWAELLEKIEDQAHAQAIEFALSEFLDEIEE